MDQDLVVIGGGAAGIVAATTGASLQARTLLIERSDRLGGECSWTGCVPSKVLLHLAGRAWQLRQAGAHAAADDLAGESLVRTRGITSDIARISGTLERLTALGVNVRFGLARLTGRQTLELAGERLRARRVLIATGSSPRLPEVSGLAAVPYRTNQTLFDLERPPRRLLVLGAGPIGIEMAQAFTRLGTHVIVISHGPRILGRDDAQLAGRLAEALGREGVQFVLGAEPVRVWREAAELRLSARRDGREQIFAGDELLVATGRRGNLDDLGLESAGITATAGALRTDTELRAARPWLLAAGDVTGKWQFSHVAEHEAVIAVRNAFFPVRKKVHYSHLPWCTFTDPELAHLGPTEDELREAGVPHRVHRFGFEREDRALSEERGVGEVKLLAGRGGRLLGAHILGPRAGELLNELVLAHRHRVRVPDLALTVHIYPTLSLAIQRAADDWWADWGQSPWLGRLFRIFTRRG
jgi:pyruvate/2-oxoglutarate dehydrogenase complex dihydrolipoamide dehydrogenase (E3) component